ncbi:H-type lectin domain-containing protein [Pseudooceanicola sp. CBS1P-1]|uniref:H-type lectin domain-containing protein n=1 Tax=Pseudooceanicola albus TaxID=2692189 RepID=A0A6L7G2M3_9RHOB|nr:MULTISPECIES: H-type lectin domain-containing protein [Pseudooceanicola]MBT9384644.1 H-type lectin domain-containing protein [Pseudooceanicola endophyticus]MXN18345.1 hypothetical protein [Pseudooceanicola albus]
MKRIDSRLIGIDQGEHLLFSDFRDGGAMWTGTGPRERRQHLPFSEPFGAPPAVHCALSMWDMDTGSNLRADLGADAVTPEGFDLVFRTWGDTRIARARIRWLAIGALRHADDWDV